MGYLLLEGGAEFGGRMSEVDRRALLLAGGESAAVDIVPAAAAPDNNHLHAGRNGVRWFRRLGARTVNYRQVIDRDSAQNTALARLLGLSRLVFFPGGFPTHLAESLRGTCSLRSICSVYRKGGVIGGSSAGAMVLCEKFYDPFSRRIMAGWNFLPGSCLIPHHNRWGPAWAEHLGHSLPDFCLLGIDEETGIINDAGQGGWTVYGAGRTVLYHRGAVYSYASGKTISHAKLPSPQVDRMFVKW